MSKPAEERLAKELSMEDHFSDEDFDVPSGPSPESSPTSPDVDLEFFPFVGILCPFKGSLQPHADMEAHSPKEEDYRREKHDIKDQMFVHLHSK
jgi:hypothetical protein